MDPKEKKAFRIYEQALEKGNDERKGFIDQECGGDAALQDHVFSLLMAADQADAGSFLGQAPGDEMKAAIQSGPNDTTLNSDQTETTNGETHTVPPSGPPTASDDLEGQKIGPYEIIKLLGMGGMGNVYLAEQKEPIKRQVALKLIKLGMDSQEVLQRFELERQILAKVKHSYIAQIHDAGTTDRGQPYFIMEYVEGIPITPYCDENQLSTHERLDLFGKVCEAIQHAHQKGIIHRDIKPSNILVTEHEGNPIPKVIDFGIAKAMVGQDQATHTALDLTKVGMAIGTLGYMSPEQAKIGDVDIDTRTDVYSLGVLLYEMLVGKLPIEPKEFKKAAWDEMFRLIREKVPEKPSSKVSTLGDASADIAARRQTQIKVLKRQLKGDLDWIIMKALEKEQDRRYASPLDLVTDLRRFRDLLPVHAGPPSKWYQTRKFVARHKVGVAATVVIFLTMTAGIIGTSLGFLKATDEAETAKETIELLEEFLSSVDPAEKGKDLKVRELLEAFKRRLEEIEKPEIQARLFLTYSKTYTGLGLLEQAHSFAVRSIDSMRALRGEDHPHTLTSMHNLAGTLRDQGKYIEAESIYREVLDKSKQVLGEGHLDTLASMNDLAVVLRNQGNYTEAESIHREGLDKSRQVLGEDHPATLTSMHNLAGTLWMQGKYTEAESIQREVLDKEKQVLGEDHPDTLASMGNLAGNLRNQGKYTEAESIQREDLDKSKQVLGEDHPATLTSMHNLALTLSYQGRYAEAESIQREVLDKERQVLGEDHPDTLTSMNNLAGTLGDQGKYTEAESIQRDVLDKSKQVLGKDHPDTLRSMHNLAGTLRNQGKYIEAESIFREVLHKNKRVLGEDHASTLTSLNSLAVTLRDQEKYTEAASIFREVLDKIRQALGENHPHTLATMANLAVTLVDGGNHKEAESIQRDVLDKSNQVLGKDHPHTLIFVCNLADTLEKQDELEEAIRLYRQAAQKGNKKAQEALKRLGQTWD